MSQIPEELIVEILPLLPVKSLLRFKAVSKDIGALIDSPDFINSHNLCKSSDQNFKLLKLICLDQSGKKFHVCDVNLDMEREILQLGKSYKSELFKVYGYCKGLTFLKRIDELFGLTLWNPSTNKYKDLPYCLEPNVEYFAISGSGLVYDDYIDDYKASIKVTSVTHSSYIEVQYLVYELKSNIWRKIENNNNRFKCNGIGCFTNGSLHWLSEHNKTTRKIDAFDVRKETFYLVPLPDCEINLMSGFSSKLHDLEGCLCISYFSRCVQFKAALYMRKKDEVVDDDQFNWIQLYSVTHPNFPGNCSIRVSWFRNVEILGYSKRGNDEEKKILLLVGTHCMVSYDLKTKSFEKIEIENKDPNWDAPILLCVESLVSV